MDTPVFNAVYRVSDPSGLNSVEYSVAIIVLPVADPFKFIGTNSTTYDYYKGMGGGEEVEERAEKKEEMKRRRRRRRTQKEEKEKEVRRDSQKTREHIASLFLFFSFLLLHFSFKTLSFLLLVLPHFFELFVDSVF